MDPTDLFHASPVKQLLLSFWSWIATSNPTVLNWWGDNVGRWVNYRDMQRDFRSRWLAVEPLASVVDQWYALRQGSAGFYEFFHQARGLCEQLPAGHVTDGAMLWHLWAHMDPHLMQVVASKIHNSSLEEMVRICSLEDRFRVRPTKPADSRDGTNGGRKNRYGRPYGGQRDGTPAPTSDRWEDGTDGAVQQTPKPEPKPGGAYAQFHVPDLAYDQCRYCLEMGHRALACAQRIARQPRTLPPEPKTVNAVIWAGTADDAGGASSSGSEASNSEDKDGESEDEYGEFQMGSVGRR